MTRVLCCAFALLALFTAGCGKKKVRSKPAAHTRPAPAIPVPVGSTERGTASWYGHPYHGRQAADGEIYDMQTLVAAHRTLPFQTWVRVRNLTNDKTVDVRIIDRGPFVGGRIIDLSFAAAAQIAMIGPGTAPVQVEVIQSPAIPEPALFGVQIGAFRDEANADRAVQSMTSAYGAARKVMRPSTPPVWRVLAGHEKTEADAETLAHRIREEQRVPEAFVVRLDP